MNERWPTYSEELFRNHGLYPWDYIRWQIWDNQKIEPRYRQNLVCYVDEKLLPTLPRPLLNRVLNVVHPDVYVDYAMVADLIMKIVKPQVRRRLKPILKRFLKV